MDILKQIGDILKQKGVNVNIKIWGKDRERTKNIKIWKSGGQTDKAIREYQEKNKDNAKNG